MAFPLPNSRACSRLSLLGTLAWGALLSSSSDMGGFTRNYFVVLGSFVAGYAFWAE